MRRHSCQALLALVLLFGCRPATAGIVVSLVPASQVVSAPSSVSVELRISGLGNLAEPSLSTFDLDVGFDPIVLVFSGFTFGDPVLGDQLDLLSLGTLSAVTPGVGTVNLFELSLDPASILNAQQAEAFTLGTLVFNTTTAGVSPLILNINALGAADGASLDATSRGGSITVTPEPSSIVMWLTGLAFAASFALVTKRFPHGGWKIESSR